MKFKSLMNILTMAAVAVMATFPLFGKEVFKLVQQWNHGDKGIYSQLYSPIISLEGHVLLREGGSSGRGSILITPKDVVFFAPRGQGPSDLYLTMAACNYSDDIAFLEYTKRIKIFTKKDNTYTWKESKWLKYPKPLSANDMLFSRDKWFFAGNIFKEIPQKKEKVFLLMVFDNKGEPLKGLLYREFEMNSPKSSMAYFLALNRNKILFMIENELKVYEISPEQLKLLREVPLETPAFYRRMPGDFYVFKESHRGNTTQFMKDVEKWKTSYSAVTHMEVDNDKLAVQIRTCDDQNKNYAMLFYNVNHFQLQKIVFTDDYFLGAVNGKYYFYANGNPGIEDEADECIINIYSFVDEK